MPKITNDQDEIRRWATLHKAHPIERAPFAPDGEPAMLGFVFGDPPPSDDSLQLISWERFFAVFHLLGLVLSVDAGTEYELLKPEAKSTGPRFEGKLQA